MAGPPKPLQLPGSNVPGSNAGSKAPPASLSLPPRPAAPPAAPAQQTPQRASEGSRTPPPALGLGSASTQPYEALVHAALAADPALAPLRHRLVPRFQRLQGAAERELLCWGEENLQTVVASSKTQADVAGRLTTLDVPGWIDRCKRDSMPAKGFSLGRLMGQRPSPDQYEAALRGLQSQMAPMINQLVGTQQQVQQEAEDLRLDAAAIYQWQTRYTDASLRMICTNRHRILVSGMQTAVQLGVQVEATRMTLLQNCQVIDQLLTVTLPAWRMMPR